MTNIDKLIAAIEAGDDRISSYLPSEHESLWPAFYKAAEGSFDAALALHEAMLPGWGWEVGRLGTGWDAKVWWRGTKGVYNENNPARAFLLVILIAYRDLQPKNDPTSANSA